MTPPLPHVNYIGDVKISLWDAMPFRVYAEPGVRPAKAFIAAAAGGSFDLTRRPNQACNWSEYTTSPDRWTGERFHVRYSAIDRSYEVRKA